MSERVTLSQKTNETRRLAERWENNPPFGGARFQPFSASQTHLRDNSREVTLTLFYANIFFIFSPTIVNSVTQRLIQMVWIQKWLLLRIPTAIKSRVVSLWVFLFLDLFCTSNFPQAFTYFKQVICCRPKTAGLPLLMINEQWMGRKDSTRKPPLYVLLSFPPIDCLGHPSKCFCTRTKTLYYFCKHTRCVFEREQKNGVDKYRQSKREKRFFFFLIVSRDCA